MKTAGSCHLAILEEPGPQGSLSSLGCRPEMDSGSVKVDGLDIAWDHGGDGDPVLLIHGLGGASSSWGQILGRLRTHFQVVAPDLPGFGRSSKPARAYTPAFFVSTLVHLLDVLEIDRTHVIGSSLGGQVALELALRAPTRVGRVVAVAPAGVPPASFSGTPALEAHRRVFDATTEQEILIARQAAGNLNAAQSAGWRSPEEVLTYVRSPGARDAFDSALRESGRARRLGPLLGHISPSPLFIWGDADPVIPVSVCQDELMGVRMLQLAVFHGCGHSPHADQTRVFTDLVTSFLAGRLGGVELPDHVVTLRKTLREREAAR